MCDHSLHLRKKEKSGIRRGRCPPYLPPPPHPSILSFTAASEKKRKPSLARYSRGTPRFRRISADLLSRNAAAVLLSGPKRQGTTKDPKEGTRMPGKTTAPALWCPSAEQIVQTVHSHLLFSPWYIVCVLAFHSERKVALWAYKQTVQKRAHQPLLFPGELAFLFRLQAVKDLES